MFERNSRQELKSIRRKLTYHAHNPNSTLIIRDLLTRVLRILRNYQIRLQNFQLPSDIDLILSSFRYDLFNLDQLRLQKVQNGNLTQKQFYETVSSMNKNMDILLGKESPLSYAKLVA